MNLLLFEAEEIGHDGLVRIGGRRARHILQVLKSEPGDQLKAGVLNGALGSARLEGADGQELVLRFTALQNPPSPLPVNLLLALPRPKALRRLFTDMASLGLKNIYLIHAAKVEKAYWHTEHLSAEAIGKALRLGLEQGADTVLPRVHLKRRFKPFVEDELPALIRGHRALVAHPGGGDLNAAQGPQTLAIGPEGGFTDYEIELLRVAGFQTATLGDRILRTETALSYFLGKALP